MKTRFAAAAAAAVAVAVLLGGSAAAPVTLARLTATATASASFGTGSLAAPTALAGTGGGTVHLGWTPSVSSTASGYAVMRSAVSGSGYTQVATVTPVSATAATDVPGAGTWFYVLQTYLGGWTSANSVQTSATVVPISSGVANCTSQTAETTGSGDNNGYQTSPGNACATDGLVASDPSSGTNTTNSCTNTGKDRHRFWGYAFGLPATVHAVNGITLTAVVGMNNNSGTTVLCAQLSGDAGLTWTAAKSVTLSGTALATYTMGTTTDTWGQAWTPAQLGTSLFRVRLTDVATVTNKTFQLDSVAVAVQYTP